MTKQPTLLLPPCDGSPAFKDMVILAIRYHLENGGVMAVRAHLNHLSAFFCFLDCWPELYCEANRLIYNFEHGNSLDESEVVLPPALATDEAMVVWEKLQRAGYIDENYQPRGSRTEAAVIANAIMLHLKMKIQWTLFEELWHRKNMYKDWRVAYDQKKTLALQNHLKEVLE